MLEQTCYLSTLTQFPVWSSRVNEQFYRCPHDWSWKTVPMSVLCVSFKLWSRPGIPISVTLIKPLVWIWLYFSANLYSSFSRPLCSFILIFVLECLPFVLPSHTMLMFFSAVCILLNSPFIILIGSILFPVRRTYLSLF